MTPLTTLYIDMNSFFASVEQHLNPALRGRPVAITAVEGETHGACVAVSYEAKAYGVKTGTLVGDARRMCPGIVFLPSRHRVYVRFNLQVAAILDEMAELERIRSVDEFQLGLSGEYQQIEPAYELVRSIKQRVSSEIGSSLRFSAGMGPNHLLAKIAGKLQKPDGCRHLVPEIMPEAVAHLELDDLPGISKRTKLKLFAAGIQTVTQLYNMDPRYARLVWHSVEGERFVRALRGMDVPLQETKRGGYGSMKVLAPEYRKPERAYLVGRWLVEKAAMRLRSDSRVAGELSLSMHGLDGWRWGQSIRCESTHATQEFLQHHRQLWRMAWRQVKHRKLLSIGIHLGRVVLISERNGDLFRPLAPAETIKQEKLSAMLDQINVRYGMDTISIGPNSPHYGFFERG